MSRQPSKPPAPDTEAALAYARAWRERAGPLAAERLRKLRDLSELDAARCFSELLDGHHPAPLRQTSGLVEQQRILSRLRRKPL